MARELTADDKKFRAQDDVRNLIQAEKIKRDAPRHKLAMAELAEMKKDLESAEGEA